MLSRHASASLSFSRSLSHEEQVFGEGVEVKRVAHVRSRHRCLQDYTEVLEGGGQPGLAYVPLIGVKQDELLVLQRLVTQVRGEWR